MVNRQVLMLYSRLNLSSLLLLLFFIFDMQMMIKFLSYRPAAGTPRTLVFRRPGRDMRIPRLALSDAIVVALAHLL